jgi:tRNA-specific 2-thiouridylase
VKGIKIKKRVFVGMSGGVDSSVSSALLKKAGFDVTGVFIKTWSPDFMECTWKDERLDAMRVCAKLDIPFITLDLEKEYKEKVADYMIEEYKKGRTPNPDVMCNKEIKFGAFFNWAMSQGADYVATGHYARTLKKKSGEVMLLAGNDDNKDQSYFLWNIKKEHLDKTLFPVGHLEKSEVRKLAKKFNLPTATKKDSQGVCFLGKVDMKDFLEHYIRPKRGEVFNESGEKIGFHDGAFFVTIGERGGFVITQKTPNDKPYFVVGKDIKKNLVFVSNKKNTILNKENEKIILNQTNWLCVEDEVLNSKNLLCRTRYRQDLEKCDLKFIKPGIFEVNLKGKKPVASGQSIVFYNKDKCLGGGIVA